MELPRRLGGALALDFVNTLDPRSGPEPRECLTSAEALTAWARAGGLATAELGPAELERAIVVREALFEVLRAVAHGETPDQAGLDAVRDAWLGVLTRSRLVAAGGQVRWEAVSDGLEMLLLPVLESALQLLAGGVVVRECEGENCGWLFVDRTKNHSRRWCSMDVCGARAKMRRYRTRARER